MAETAAAAAKAFVSLPKDDMLKLESLTIPCDKTGGCYVWDILPPGKEVTEDMRKPAQQGLVDIDLTKPLDSMFFDHFFPSLEVSVPS